MSQLRVLLINDNVAGLHLMTAAFEVCPDVQLVTHDHAPTALHWVEAQWRSHHLPHLVLLDLYMPGMDGLSWLRALQHQPELHVLPVLLYSLTPPDLQEQQVQHPQLCGCWQKPMTFTEVQEQAEHLCEVWERERIFTPMTLGRGPAAHIGL